MFNVNYPGACFGNFDFLVKECKKCKIKQFCKRTENEPKEGSGIFSFKKMLLENFFCEIEVLEKKTVITCYDKNSFIEELKDLCSPKCYVDFNNDGSVLIEKDEVVTEVKYIVSEEKAKELFDKICK